MNPTDNPTPQPVDEELEILIRKNALKDVEVWLYEQYKEIDAKLLELAKGKI